MLVLDRKALSERLSGKSRMILGGRLGICEVVAVVVALACGFNDVGLALKRQARRWNPDNIEAQPFARQSMEVLL